MGSSSNTNNTNTCIRWSHCHVNCGCHCAFKWVVENNRILCMDTTFEEGSPHPATPCHLGAHMLDWIESDKRLRYPLKRCGKRGSGQFERISWDEAIDIVCDKLRFCIDRWGNDSIYLAYGTGAYSATGNPSKRLLNCLGGFLDHAYDYSTNMMQGALAYLFGDQYSPYDAIHASSFSEAEAHSDYVLMFGSNPKATRMGGAGTGHTYERMREAVLLRGGKVVHIDVRQNETCHAHPDSWIPIRSGTDAALACALVHEFLIEGACDLDFLHTYCIGFDEQTMPIEARGQHASFSDYLLGLGADAIEKTPEWAQEITGIAARTIRSLAHDLMASKAPFIVQGWGPQRHANGEDTTRAICMIPLALGAFGLPGTNPGTHEADPQRKLVEKLPHCDTDPDGAPKNKVRWRIPCYTWLDAITQSGIYHTQTPHNPQEIVADEVLYEDTRANNVVTEKVSPDKTLVDQVLHEGPLPNSIHFIWNYAGNCLTNQHTDINHVHDVLTHIPDSELFILCWDTFLTDSARYADLILPDALRSEQLSMFTQAGGEWETRVVVGGPAQDPPDQIRPSFDVMADIAQRFGMRERFTRGLTHDEWVRKLYEDGRKQNPELPAWDTMLEQGLYKTNREPAIGFQRYRANPDAYKLGTPSGKIEIYSQRLAALAKKRTLAEGDTISPIPCYTPGFMGPCACTQEFPLHAISFHSMASIHSSFASFGLGNSAATSLWIHEQDAKERGIKQGDTVHVESPAGAILLHAYVTDRIVQGCVAIPQGHWHTADMEEGRLDTGGCVNTLTSYHPSPLARGNGTANSIIVQVKKFEHV